MDPLQWQQAKALIAAVLSQEPVDRGAFLSQNCPDPVLRAEIDALLEHQSKSSTILKLSIGGAADDGNDLPPGSRVGPYVILGQLGRGGMGEVFLGSDPRLHRKVALKCLLRSSDAVGDSRSQILREARAAARVKHPNVAAVHDLVEHAGRAFIVMEYVEGESLAARLQRAQLPVSSIIAMGRELASALAAAHAQGIVHRDLKPANIQVTPEGSVKVLDFGVAAAVALLSTTVSATSTSTTGAELRGLQPGTLGYMSPEQMLGRDVGPRSDIFSLGVVLYEMASGRRPYRGGDRLEVLGAVLKRPTPVHELNPQASPRLSEIIARALETDPDRRFESASELERALDGLEHSHDTARVGSDSPSAAEFDGTNTVAASELRGRLLLAQSSADLRRLKYEVEGYLSMRPHDVDGRMLNDEIERAIGLNVLTVDDQSKAGRHQETTGARSRRSYYRWAVFATMAVVVLGGGLWLRQGRRQFVVVSSSEPDLPPHAAMGGAPPPVSPTTASEPPARDLSPGVEKRLESLRRIVRRQYARGERQQALASATTGLLLSPQDVEIRNFLDQALKDARSEAGAARAAALAAISADPPSTTYQDAGRRLQAARLAEPGAPLEAIPAYWMATGLFVKAAAEAKSAPPLVEAIPPPSPLADVRPAPVPEPPAVQPRPPASEEPAIRALIGAYAEAYSNLDVRAVQKAYPGVNAEALRRAFSELKSQKVQIQGEQIHINGAMATVTLTWQMVAIGLVGGPVSASQEVEFTLQKTGVAWIIADRR